MTQTFPSFMYGPDGQAQVFASVEDVPDGWKDHPSKVKGAEKPGDAAEDKRLSRAELMEALRQRGVQFAPNAGGGELARLLALSERQGVQVDSNGKALGEAKPEPVRDPEPPPQPAPEHAFVPLQPLPPSPTGPFAGEVDGISNRGPASPGLDPNLMAGTTGESAQVAPAPPAERVEPAPAPFVPFQGQGFSGAPATGLQQPFGGLDRDRDGHDGGSLPATPPALTGKNKAELQAIARAAGVEFDEDASNRELREAIEAGRA